MADEDPKPTGPSSTPTTPGPVEAMEGVGQPEPPDEPDPRGTTRADLGDGATREYHERGAGVGDTAAAAASGHDLHVAQHEHHGPHAVPLSLLALIFAALMVLTGVTVGVTYVDFGSNANLLIALGVAVVKAALVVLYFMHLRWDSPFNAVCLIGSFLFVMLFIAVATLDTGQYAKNYEPPGGYASGDAAGTQ